jgi:hypothetical protein
MSDGRNKPNWKQDLARGDAGEREFLATFPLYRKGEDVNRYEHDFVHSLTGATVELKTDYYDMHQTPNLIVERYSNYERKTPGGPYRHNGDLSLWVYYYRKNGVFLMYDPQQLIEKVESLYAPLVPVQNDRYVTMVHKIPRTAVEDCLVEVVHTPSYIR